jgi:PTS system mannose-specific IIC component
MFYFLLKYSMLGGLLMLDSAAIGQWMFSHPIIAASLIGLIGGDPLAGLIIGVLCQLFWSHKMPVGAYNPPETSLFAISSIINYLLACKIGSMGFFHPLIILVLLVGLLGGIWGGELTVYIRKFNNRFPLLADKWATEGAFGKIQSIPVMALALAWSLYTLFLFLLGCLFYLLYPLINHLPLEGCYIIYYPWILLAISVAVLIEINHSLKRWKILLAGLAFGCLAGFLHGYFIR